MSWNNVERSIGLHTALLMTLAGRGSSTVAASVAASDAAVGDHELPDSGSGLIAMPESDAPPGVIPTPESDATTFDSNPSPDHCLSPAVLEAGTAASWVRFLSPGSALP